MRDGFGKVLVSNYFEQMHPSKVITAKFTDKYAGIIICELIEGTSITYLDKIVVAKEFQKHKIGSQLWDFASIDYSKFCWRAKKENPINDFYLKKSSGSKEFSKWVVYWTNLTKSETGIARGYALAKPETLILP